MGGLSKSTKVESEDEVNEESAYPDDDVAKARAEEIFDEVYKIMAAGAEAKTKGPIRFRIRKKSIVNEVKSRIFECIYMYTSYDQMLVDWHDKRGVQSAKIALAEVQKIIMSLDAIPRLSMETFLNKTPKRGSIFGKSWRRSAEKFADHCTKKIAGAQKSKGRPANDKIDLITEEVVGVFEFWVGRKFKKTTALAKGTDPGSGGFVGLDAVCVYSILKGIEPSITVSRVKTALNKMPPRSRNSPETF